MLCVLLGLATALRTPQHCPNTPYPNIVSKLPIPQHCLETELPPPRAVLHMPVRPSPLPALPPPHPTHTYPSMQVRILVKRDELTLEGIKQFYVNVEKEDWKLDTLVSRRDDKEGGRVRQ